MAASSSESKNVECAVGISLGATNCCVAIWLEDNPVVVVNSFGNPVTPSVVAFGDSERLVGESACRSNLEPSAVVTHAKRFLGRKFSELSIEERSRYAPGMIRQGRCDSIEFQVQFRGNMKSYSPEEIVAMTLGNLKDSVNSHIGQYRRRSNYVVITVPAYFDDRQRQAAKDATTIAGFKVLRAINEPTAALLVYGIDKVYSKEAKCLVIDIGGSTFDISLVLIEDGIFEILNTFHDGNFGGDAFDERLLGHFVDELRGKHEVDITKDHRKLARMRQECRRLKEVLSDKFEASVDIDDLLDGGATFTATMTRTHFEELCRDLLRKCVRAVESFLRDVNQPTDGLQEVVFVGGCTSIPKLKRMLSSMFSDCNVNATHRPAEVCALGAAVQAEVLGTPVANHDVLYGCNLPLSVGVCKDGGAMLCLAVRNSMIPLRRSRHVTTKFDNQRAMWFRVFEGERKMASDNHFLGEFVLSGLPPRAHGTLRVEVSIEVDYKGIITISAKEQETRREASLILCNDSGFLSTEQINKMVEEAERMKNLQQGGIAANEDRNEPIPRYAPDIGALVAISNRVGNISGDDVTSTRTPTSSADRFFNYTSAELTDELYPFMEPRVARVFSSVCRWACRGVTRHLERMEIVALPEEVAPRTTTRSRPTRTSMLTHRTREHPKNRTYPTIDEVD